MRGGLALRKRFCRSFNFELQAAATDDGIVISLSEQHSFPLEVILQVLERRHGRGRADAGAAGVADVHGALALGCLTRAGDFAVSLAVARCHRRFSGCARTTCWHRCSRIRWPVPKTLTGDIRIPDHPLVNESIRDCLHEAMDLQGLVAVLEAIERGEIRTAAIDTAEPSPFSHEILNANPYAFLDDAPLEERRARAVQMRRTLPADAGEIGALDPEAIAEVASGSWPLVRDADELHDGLLTLVVVPPERPWADWFGTLRQSGRAHGARYGRRVSCGSPPSACRWPRAAYPESVARPDIPAFDRQTFEDRESAVTEVVHGWLESTGPCTAPGLATRLCLPRSARGCRSRGGLEAEGQILRGRFSRVSGALTTETEWCNRRLLARIHRLTLGTPATRDRAGPLRPNSSDSCFGGSIWHQVHSCTAPTACYRSSSSCRDYEISAAAWEPQVLRRRIARYGPDMLDQLCLAGEVMWGRLSTASGVRGDAGGTGRSQRRGV